MSTKINNAWKWEGDFFSFNQEIQKTKDDIINCMSAKVNKYLARKAYTIFDQILLYKTQYNTMTTQFERHIKDVYDVDINSSNKDDILSNVILTESLMLNKYEKNDIRSVDEKDFSVSATVFPFSNNIQLMILYVQDYECYDEIYEIMENHGFKEYSYNNQIDCPQSISEEEWKKRENDWSEVFSQTGIPKYAGYEYFFFDSFLYETKNTISKNTILSYAESISERAYRCSKNYLHNKALKNLSENELRKFSLVEKAIASVDEDEIKAVQYKIEKILNA